MKLLLLACLAFAQVQISVEDMKKDGSMQALQQSFGDAFSIRGGNVSGASSFLGGAYIPYASGKMGVATSLLIKSTDTTANYILTVSTLGVVILNTTTTAAGYEFLTRPNDRLPYRIGAESSGTIDLMKKTIGVSFGDIYILDTANVAWRISMDRYGTMVTTNMGAI